MTEPSEDLEKLIPLGASNTSLRTVTFEQKPPEIRIQEASRGKFLPVRARSWYLGVPARLIEKLHEAAALQDPKQSGTQNFPIMTSIFV